MQRTLLPVASTSGQSHARSSHSSHATSSLPVGPVLSRSLPVHKRTHVRLHSAPVATSAPVTKREVMADKWWQKGSAPNMRECSTIQEIVDELADAGEKLVIVEFYAPWCGACKAVYPKICKLVAEHPDKVKVLKVSFEDNKELCKSMGVKVLPYFHFYRGALGRVDAFSCTVSKIQKFKDALEDYTSPFCNLEEVMGLPEFPEIKPQSSLGSIGGLQADNITQLAWS